MALDSTMVLELHQHSTPFEFRLRGKREETSVKCKSMVAFCDHMDLM